MSGNHWPSEITRVHHPTAATGEEQIGFLLVYISTLPLVTKDSTFGPHLSSTRSLLMCCVI